MYSLQGHKGCAIPDGGSSSDLQNMDKVCHSFDRGSSNDLPMLEMNACPINNNTIDLSIQRKELRSNIKEAQVCVFDESQPQYRFGGQPLANNNSVRHQHQPVDEYRNLIIAQNHGNAGHVLEEQGFQDTLVGGGPREEFTLQDFSDMAKMSAATSSDITSLIVKDEEYKFPEVVYTNFEELSLMESQTDSDSRLLESDYSTAFLDDMYPGSMHDMEQFLDTNSFEDLQPWVVIPRDVGSSAADSTVQVLGGGDGGYVMSS